MNLSPSDNRPIIAVAAGMVAYEGLTELVDLAADAWALSPGLVTALTVLAGAVAAAVIGLITEHVGESAPWAASSHYEALRDALAVDPHELEPGQLEQLGLGPDDLDRIDVPWTAHED